MNRKALIAAIALPIFALAVLVGLKEFKKATGVKLVLDIRGYDPRDLLSGHYITFRVDFKTGKETICSYRRTDQIYVYQNEGVSVYGCLHDSVYSESGITYRTYVSRDYPPQDNHCTVVLKGVCERGSFRVEALERFYIPQNDAYQLNSLARSGKGAVKVTVGDDGSVVINDLLIDGVSWKKYLQNQNVDNGQ